VLQIKAEKTKSIASLAAREKISKLGRVAIKAEK